MKTLALALAWAALVGAVWLFVHACRRAGEEWDRGIADAFAELDLFRGEGKGEPSIAQVIDIARGVRHFPRSDDEQGVIDLTDEQVDALIHQLDELTDSPDDDPGNNRSTR